MRVSYPLFYLIPIVDNKSNVESPGTLETIPFEILEVIFEYLKADPYDKALVNLMNARGVCRTFEILAVNSLKTLDFDIEELLIKKKSKEQL